MKHKKINSYTYTYFHNNMSFLEQLTLEWGSLLEQFVRLEDYDESYLIYPNPHED